MKPLEATRLRSNIDMVTDGQNDFKNRVIAMVDDRILWIQKRQMLEWDKAVAQIKFEK
jgi:hypothetical protein